jgi:hypothetical protein
MAIKGSKVSTVVVYHKDCADGFGAAYATWKALADRPKYVPVSYDGRNSFVDEVEKLTYSPVDTLYVVDFSFDLSQLSRLSKLCGRIVVLDHHDTARNELMVRGAVNGRQLDDWTTKPEIQRLGNIYIEFDMERAGCQLTWDNFFRSSGAIGNVPRPRFIDYLGWRDLWWHKRRDTHKKYAEEIEALHLYLNAMPYDFHTWDYVCNHLEETIQKGRPILAFYKQQLRIGAASCVDRMVNWPVSRAGFKLRVGLVNVPLFFASDMTEFVYEREFAIGAGDYKMLAFWCIERDCRAHISLRSREREGDIHCGDFAKVYGGGGHPGAAGFSVAPAQLETIFIE